MPELNNIEKSIYLAVCELTNASPDGELTYTKILTSYISGAQNSKIPWAVLQKSNVYGKFPKANLMTVMLACNKLVDLGFLTKTKIDGSYKYFVTSKPIDSDSEEKLFLGKVSKYKRYLIEQFSKCLINFCPSLEGAEHNNYYGFINKNPLNRNERNWIWISDESNEPNSLKVFVRQRPNFRGVLFVSILSESSFNDVIDEIVDVLEDEKETYKLKFSRNVNYPSLLEPISAPKKPSTILETELDASFFDDYGKDHIFFNDGSEDSVNASLTVSESSPYKYSGDTLFSPRDLRTLAKGKYNFDFSFLKWKVVAWTKTTDDHLFVQNVLLVSKKIKNNFVFISIPKRKVICHTTNNFYIKKNGELISCTDLVDEILK